MPMATAAVAMATVAILTAADWLHAYKFLTRRPSSNLANASEKQISPRDDKRKWVRSWLRALNDDMISVLVALSHLECDQNRLAWAPERTRDPPACSYEHTSHAVLSPHLTDALQ